MATAIPRTAARLVLLLPALAALAPGQRLGAEPFRRGDVLLTSSNTNEVLHARPRTGEVWTLSPRPGSTNHLIGARGVVHLAEVGVVFAASQRGLVAIDPDTGA